MKLIFTISIISVLLFSCSPKIGSTIFKKLPPLTTQDYVIVLQIEDSFTNNGTEIGTIKSGDNGFSSNCTYTEVIDKLKQIAKENGANIIKITEHKNANQWSSCERIKAKIYNVPNYKIYEKEIEWNADRKLTWDDFKAPQKNGIDTAVAAQSYCGFSFNTNRFSLIKKVKIHVTNVFTTNLSWVNPVVKNNMEILMHEQGHFDISEIYARVLKKSIAESKLKVVNFNKIANEIFKKVYAQYLIRQQLYESETEHGFNHQKQIEWLNLINKELTIE